jgi:cellulose synthase/poly-beta-1,6-N-acetylglucosamine synthase-like glycosyltransferase
MLARLVICSAFGLLLSFVALFLFGHRLRRGHWLVSLAVVLSIAAMAWGLHEGLTNDSPPLDRTLGFALLAGAVVTATFERWNALAHACFTAALLAAGLYLSYAAFVLSAAHLGPWSLGFGLVLFVLQFASMALLLVNTFEILDVLCRTQWQHKADAKPNPNYAPKVSIHVPTHREPPEMVIETLNALARLDYSNYEVLVIDNNTDDEELWRPVEQHCARLGRNFRFFHLLPWPGYKSGALNFALKQTASDAEIIGIVDADYQVQRDWLADLVGHFADPQMSFVQTPQDYRDTNSRGFYGKVLALAYIYFFRISMASRNEHNAIIFAGTMGLLRKTALEEVGGWDEWCITEDAEVSLRLLKAGYRSVYVDHTYGHGIMPLDYAGLKKQRFRWAFGGMQLLRMHARELFNPWAKGQLTFAQRWAYLSGGLQWLNDPLALAFTALLLIGAGTHMVGGTFAVQPFLGAVVFVPPVFVLFAIARFLWALRVRERCSFAEALGALAVLLGLTWVVTLACIRGLVSRQGVFLRTPKQGGVADIRDTFAIVRWESWIAAACIGLAAAMVADISYEQLAGRAVISLLLCWQAAIFLSAVFTSLWDYQQRRGRAAPRRLGFRTVGHATGRGLWERQTAGWVALALLLLGQALYFASERAPVMERVFRTDPLRQFLPAPSVLAATAEEQAGAVLVVESEAAVDGDVEKALSLWSPEGMIVDENFSPGYAGDDQVWQGRDALRERYGREFKQRRYLSNRHLNLDITIENGQAIIVNDLDAVVQSDRSAKSKRLQLARTDRWFLKQVDGRWEIVRLELNRTPQAIVSTKVRESDEHQNKK